MIMSEVLGYVKNNGICTSVQIANDLNYDRDTVEMILKELVVRKKINLNEISSEVKCADCSLKCNSICKKMSNSY